MKVAPFSGKKLDPAEAGKSGKAIEFKYFDIYVAAFPVFPWLGSFQGRVQLPIHQTDKILALFDKFI